MIIRRLWILTFMLFVGVQAQSQEALSARIASYDIAVELDVDNKMIYGQQVLYWKNPSAVDTVYELQYHLYHNAFKNSKTTFMRERGFDLLDQEEEECNWSYIDIQKIEDEYGNDLMENIEYIQPDDGNEFDQTVLRVPLVEPVLPGDSIQVDLDWIGKIPKIQPRTGYNKDYYFMVQWFPKVGVYEPAGMRYATQGQWNCHQYHSNGEYYANFGNYRVDITVTKDYIVGASGSLQKEKAEGKKKTYTYAINDVIDFAWSASPHFVERRTQWKEVDIRLLCYPDHVHIAERYFTAIKHSMEYLDKYIGDYPYKTLTIIDPPYHGIFSSGMEYPTLITTLSACFLPKGIKTTETIAVHEYIHQYFMQMVATHEQEEPWMDEGITTYYEGRILNHYYGENTSTIDFLGITVGNIEYNRIEFFNMKNPKIGDNSFYARQFTQGGYGPISYNKTAIWLRTLEGLVGIETMDKIMKTYFERWKFKHPCARDFINVVNEVVRSEHDDDFGENMYWFFNQVLYSAEICDYELGAVYHQKAQPLEGYFPGTEVCQHETDYDWDSAERTATVVAYRNGEVMMPIEILVQFEDGSSILEKWDGKARFKEYNYPGRVVECAELDPERKIYLDKNFLNNGITLQSQKPTIRKYVTRILSWIQHSMQNLSVLI